jgi:thiol-disulfide isomerase/thioredoxin
LTGLLYEDRAKLPVLFFYKETCLETLLLISSVLLWLIVLGNLLLTLTVIRRINAGLPGEKRTLTGLHAGEAAPSFSARTLDGQTRTLADYADRATALVFMASGCGACKALLPALGKIDSQAQQSKTELVLVFDGDEEQIRALVEPFAFQFPVLLAPRNDNALFQDYQVHGTPAYYLLNEQGQIQAGGHPGSHDQQWQKLVEAWTSPSSLAEGSAV